MSIVAEEVQTISTRSEIENGFREKLDQVNDFIEAQLKNCEHQISEIRALMHKNTEDVKTLIANHIGLGEAAAQSAIDIQQTLIAQMDILQGKVPVKLPPVKQLETSISRPNDWMQK